MAFTPDQIRDRAAAAEALLGNSTFNAVCEEMIAAGVAGWLATNEREIREREELHTRVRAIAALREELQARVDAFRKLAADDALKERRKKEI